MKLVIVVVFRNSRRRRSYRLGQATEVPGSDFANVKFDTENSVSTSNIVVILSTQRSGSTYLCELLWRSDICTAHEYFQPYQYMPMMAARWGAGREGEIDMENYVSNLMRYRTNDNGWLGINVHGSHIPAFQEALPWFRGVTFHYIYLYRLDTIAQAVSYEIASQTKRWSSNFDGNGETKYNFRQILKKLRRIDAQNTRIRAFLLVNQLPYKAVSYEELTKDGLNTVASILPIRWRPPNLTGLKKQATAINEDWRRRFATDYLRNECENESSLLERLFDAYLR